MNNISRTEIILRVIFVRLMDNNSITYRGEQLEWPAVYLKMFSPMMIVVLITIGVDAWVEYSTGGLSPFFYKDLVTIGIIAFAYVLFLFKKIHKTMAINVTVYSIVIGIMALLPFRLDVEDFHFESYFLKVEIVLVILTYAIGILVNPWHILYLLILNLVFIAFCIYGMQGEYPIAKFIFYIMLMTCTSLLGYKLNRIFFDLNHQVSAANALIQSQNEDLKRTIAAKDQLFEILGHDLKAPFFHLSALLTLSDHTEDPEKKKEYKQMMKDAIKEGDQLVASILDWVDVQSTYMNFELHEGSVNEIVADTVLSEQIRAKLKDIQIETDIEPELRMQMDSQMMATVLRNIICNAVKYSHRNSTIQVVGKKGPDHIILQVIDKGIGMSEEIKNELFMYGKISTRVGTEQESGSGFGLNICKKMVENQNGTMDLQSVTGKGTTVTMRFPHAHG